LAADEDACDAGRKTTSNHSRCARCYAASKRKMNTPIETKDVVVVGAGVVGLAAALGFAQAGLKVALVGPAPRLFAPSVAAPFDERIYALAPSSVELLTRLRVWPSVNAGRMQRVTRMRVFGDAG